MAINAKYDIAKQKEPLPIVNIWAINELDKDQKGPADPYNDATKYPMISFNIKGEVITYISDPDVVQDMYTKHSTKVDKHQVHAEIRENMFTEIFTLMPTNDLWKARRKACSQMFYKDRLRVMTGIFKEHLNRSCDQWIKEIEANGEARINIATEFERILGNSISNICFGEDFSEEQFDFQYYDVMKHKFTAKKVGMREAMPNTSKQCFQSYLRMLMHPITGPLKILFGLNIRYGAFEDTVAENGAKMHRHIMQKVQDRKNGLSKSKMQGYDLLSVFLED